MKLSIWQQFSSNHSSHFALVGVFETPEAAKATAERINAIFHMIRQWHTTNPDASKKLWDESPPTPSPVELEIGREYKLTWSHALEWIMDKQIQARVVLDRLVYIDPTWQTDSVGQPFDQIMAALGGRALIDGYSLTGESSIILIDLSFMTPDEHKAQEIHEHITQYPYAVEEYPVEPKTERDGLFLHYHDWAFAELNLERIVPYLREQECTNIQYSMRLAWDHPFED